MIIEWLKERMLVIPVLPTEKEIKAAKGKKIHHSGSVKLQPGCNNVPDAIWMRIQHSVENHINDKNIVIHNVTIADGKEKKISFSDMDANAISQIIEKTYNLESIDAWLEVEKREEIRLMLRKRKELIKDFIAGKIKKIK